MLNIKSWVDSDRGWHKLTRGRPTLQGAEFCSVCGVRHGELGSADVQARVRKAEERISTDKSIVTHQGNYDMSHVSPIKLGMFKVDTFEKCGLRISISHFGHNLADFKYPLRAETESTHFHCPSSVLSVVRVSKKCCSIKTRIKKCWRSHSVIYFSQISPSTTNSAHPWPHIIKQSSDSQDRKYPI